MGLDPYFGFLALASSFIVTCDSASMLAEACATGKHVYMFDLIRPSVTSLCFLDPDQVRAFLYRKVMWGLAPKRLTRDIRIVHRFLLNSGRVVSHGEKFTHEPPPPLHEMLTAVSRTHELLGSAGQPGSDTKQRNQRVGQLDLSKER